LFKWNNDLKKEKKKSSSPAEELWRKCMARNLNMDQYP